MIVMCVYVMCVDNSSRNKGINANVSERKRKFYKTKICTMSVMCVYLLCVDDGSSNGGSGQRVDQKNALHNLYHFVCISNVRRR